MLIPSWLRNSSLYKELINVFGDDEELQIPAEFMPVEGQTCLESVDECIQLLKVMSYWCLEVKYAPLYFFDFLINFGNQSHEQFHQKLLQYDPLLVKFLQNTTHASPQHNLLYFAIRVGHIGLLDDLLYKKKILVVFFTDLVKEAIELNSFDAFQFLFNKTKGHLLQPQQTLLEQYAKIACRVGAIQIFDVLFRFNRELILHKQNQEELAKAAASHGHLSMLEHLKTKGFSFSLEVFANSLAHFSCFRYLFESVVVHRIDEPEVERYLEVAAFKVIHPNRRETFFYLYEKTKSCEFWYKHNEFCLASVQWGLLDLLEFCHEHGMPWNSEVTETAASHGFLSCLVYAHQQGCPWTESVLILSAQNDMEDCFLYAMNNGCPRPKYCVFSPTR